MSRDDRTTNDGKFKGRKYYCSVCGQTYRRREMKMQRGKLACRETCVDEDNKSVSWDK